MKFLNLNSFKAYLSKAEHHQYLIIIDNEYERRKVIDLILKKPFISNFSITKLIEPSFQKIVEEVDSPSLFGGDPFIVLEDIKDLKEETSKFFSFFKERNIFGIIGSKTKQDVLSIYDNAKVVLDLSSEKPWEKEKRFLEFVKEKCQIDKITISQEALNFLIESCSNDFSFLEQEIDKLIVFCLEKKRIEIEDVLTIGSSNMQTTVWQVAEEMVWQKKDIKNLVMDASFFHSLISSIRFQLSLGYKMASLMETNMSYEEFAKHFPKIYPKMLDKKKEIAKLRGSLFYKNALKVLFEIDLLSKNNISNFSLLLDLFRLKSLS
jgi:DNA polymerase III subunit delta